MIFKNKDLTAKRLQKLFEDAAHGAKVDDEGDVYVTGNGIEFPCWVSFQEQSEVLLIFTYVRMKPETHREAALEFVNLVNEKVALPSFYIKNDKDGRICFWGQHSIPTEFGLEGKFIIGNVTRFASAFKYAAQLDTEDVFFD